MEKSQFVWSKENCVLFFCLFPPLLINIYICNNMLKCQRRRSHSNSGSSTSQWQRSILHPLIQWFIKKIDYIDSHLCCQFRGTRTTKNQLDDYHDMIWYGGASPWSAQIVSATARIKQKVKLNCISLTLINVHESIKLEVRWKWSAVKLICCVFAQNQSEKTPQLMQPWSTYFFIEEHFPVYVFSFYVSEQRCNSLCVLRNKNMFDRWKLMIPLEFKRFSFALKCFHFE